MPRGKSIGGPDAATPMQAARLERVTARRIVTPLIISALFAASCGLEIAEAPRDPMPENIPPITAVQPTLPDEGEDPEFEDDAVAEPVNAFDLTWASTPIRLRTIVQLDQAIDLRGRSGTLDLYVAQKTGVIHRIERGFSARTGAEDLSLASRSVLDISDQVSTGNEQGLLAFTFSSDGRRLFVSSTDLDGASVLTEYLMGSTRADVGSARVLMRVPQPFPNHNGGDLHFGPDGFLYWSLGDGGGAGDPLGTGQDAGDLLGSILRIDLEATETREYTPAPGNPFIGTAGADEVWTYGLRNPWRFSFDPENGDLWIADVGQDLFEEITVLPAGQGRAANLGWNTFEGNQIYEGGEPASSDTIAPTVEYAHDGIRCSVTGGYVMRDEAMPALAGIYLASDACSGEIFGTQAASQVRFEVMDVITDDEAPLAAVWSFGRDDDGQIYVIEADGTVSRIVPPPVEDDEDEG